MTLLSRGMALFPAALPRPVAVQTFFLVVAGISPDVSALLAPGKVAPKEAAIAVPLSTVPQSWHDTP